MNWCQLCRTIIQLSHICELKIRRIFRYFQKVSRMVERIRRFQLLNNQIFGILSNYLQPVGESGEEIPDDRIREFAPPVHHSIAHSFPSGE